MSEHQDRHVWILEIVHSLHSLVATNTNSYCHLFAANLWALQIQGHHDKMKRPHKPLF